MHCWKVISLIKIRSNIDVQWDPREIPDKKCNGINQNSLYQFSIRYNLSLDRAININLFNFIECWSKNCVLG